MSHQIGNLEVLYDQEADVLYLSVGQPNPSSIIEDQEGLLIQRDLATGEVVGATILDYQQRFSLYDMLPLRRLANQVTSGHDYPLSCQRKFRPQQLLLSGKC